MFVQQTLHVWRCPTAVDAAELVTSELVTNAVTATGTTDPHPAYSVLATVPVIRVRLSLHSAALIIEVWDVSLKPPALREHEDAEHGRGLHIVNAESDLWGVYFPKIGGKVVWAEIALRSAAASGTTRPRAATPTRKANPARAMPAPA